jgi:hypothetical protein
VVFIKITEIQIGCKWKGRVKWEVREGSDGGGRNGLGNVPGMRRGGRGMGIRVGVNAVKRALEWGDGGW